ncbi:enoyl-ACP reductase FabI [Legionella fallonii]|uniref:Enoyl-[acyl-carrier-protein] reductase [NADH] n=1 Tax=Legionella fallonii LLAP-10 TaxID=1212491 RepID=A0A098G8M8_9GAMM|nr:enoyl-ACP reductase FabI [Legionella fallonii]CEG58344.1 Enoyl-[acyl-carrier-protein] reductase [NADH] FabI [Legionella fallonii LLAP-10]
MIIDLTNKKGLVTGISNEHSIAYGCAEQFRESNAELATTFLNAKAEPFMRPLALQVKSPLILPCNVQKEEEIIALFAAIEKKWGKLDFMLHSMAFAPKADLEGPLVECSKEGFLEAMDISCHSLIRLSKYAVPLMKNGGSILTMTYYGSQKVILNYNLMGVVKAALEASVRYLASELGAKKIRVNAISPGPIKTRASSGIPNFNEYIDAEEQRSPLHHLVDIKNVGNLAAFLVSDAAVDITGQVHYVDAGYSIMG